VASIPSGAQLLTIAVVACSLCSAQEYNFRYFGAAEGLTNLAIRQLHQDSQGFLWVGTEHGVFRYDGERFDNFGPAQGLPAKSGATFGEAPDGSLLAGGDFGLYNLIGDRFERVPLDADSVHWAQGIQADGKGNTYIGTDSGLVELSSPFLPPDSDRVQFRVRRLRQAPGTSGPAAYGILIDGASVWYGCGLELCRLAAGKDSKTPAVFGRGSGLPPFAILVIQKDGDGNLWVRAKNAGIFILPKGQTKFIRPESPVSATSIVGVPAVDSEGRILLSSPNGLLIHGTKGWQEIGRSAGLRGTPYAAVEDRQRSLWIGLAGRGLARWRGYREWQSYTAQSGLGSDLVYEILPLADGSLRVATEGGLFRGVRQGSGVAWSKVAGVGSVPVHSVRLAPDGDLWIGTETQGAARIRSATGAVEWFNESRGLAARAPYALRFDSKHWLWAATDAGLFVAKPPYRRFSRIAELPATRFWTVAMGSDGALWAGGASGLFVHVDGAEGERVKGESNWQKYGRADGLSNQEVIALGAAPDRSMWIGYRFGGGIDHVSRESDGISVKRGVQRPGSDGIVYFLEFDSSGRLWAGTERGVDVWDGVRWGHYDSSDGLAWDDCNLNGFAAEADGTVWIGTSGGLSRFTPLPRPPLTSAPKVVFTKLLIGRTDVSGRQNPRIFSNSFKARYSVLNTPRENGLVFRYRLTPANSAWTETNQRELEFAQLAPGAYRLEVEAGDNDGVWSGYGNGSGFSFEILAPWYRTLWFACLCGTIPLLIVAAVIRFRMANAKKREWDLVRVVQEKTMDLTRANEDLLRLSSLDPLTGLANRRIFDQTLERECARLTRTESYLSLILLDIDHFKALNDSEGHQRGDDYLRSVGMELRRLASRKIDVAARCGGEEFALILPGIDAEAAARFAESVRLAIAGLELPHKASPVAPVITASLGVSTATPESCGTPRQLIKAADEALYIAKRSGRNRVEMATSEVHTGGFHEVFPS
jgi:diguanylate cyclase (GGDEF)-like protein